MEDVSQEVIKTTQQTLGPYVKKPPLTEKLLRKPPFRFLHDIITTIIRNTGFFDGVFDENELISENVKDRESKVIFLNKLIAILVTTTGKSINVKPNKIIAGQEPQKTNELLQLLAEALDKKLSSVEAVQKYKNNQTVTSKDDRKIIEQADKTKKSDKPNQLKSKSSEKLTSNKKNVLPKNESNIIEKTKAHKELVKKLDKNGKSKSIINKPSKEEPARKKDPKYCDDDINATKTKEINVISDAEPITINEALKDEREIIENNINSNAIDDDPIPIKVQLNTSYTIIDSKGENPSKSAGNLEISANTDSATNQSSVAESTFVNDTQMQKHYTPEKVKVAPSDSTAELIKSYSFEKQPTPNLLNNEKSHSLEDSKANIETTRSTFVRPPSSRPGAPRLKDKQESSTPVTNISVAAKVNIIEENSTKDDEDESGIVIVDPIINENNSLTTSNQHGHLVQQILDSHKEFSQANKTEIEWKFDKLKEKEYLNQEMENARINIQALSKVANPLGKLLDHVQEDVEVMRQELMQWKTTDEEARKELSKAKLINEESLTQLHLKSRQLDEDIQQKRYKINVLKLIVHQNNLRIDKLITNGNMQ